MNGVGYNNDAAVGGIHHHQSHPKLYSNLSSIDEREPQFLIPSLPADSKFTLHLFASNSKGRSPSLVINAPVISLSEKQTHRLIDSSSVSPDDSVVLTPFIGALILSGVILCITSILALVCLIRFKICKSRRGNYSASKGNELTLWILIKPIFWLTACRPSIIHSFSHSPVTQHHEYFDPSSSSDMMNILSPCILAELFSRKYLTCQHESKFADFLVKNRSWNVYLFWGGIRDWFNLRWSTSWNIADKHRTPRSLCILWCLEHLEIFSHSQSATLPVFPFPTQTD